MAEWLFHSTSGWITVSTLVIVICGVVAWFVPFLRRWAIEIIVLIVGATALYLRGVADRAKREKEMKDAAVKRNQEKFDKIDARPDTDGDVNKRLRDGSF
jgi:Flp pilus assembly protein TadB